MRENHAICVRVGNPDQFGYIFTNNKQDDVEMLRPLRLLYMRPNKIHMNILTQSIAITDNMFNFGNILTKNAITFDQKEIERKKRYHGGMKFCCASNAAIKKFKIARKKINFFPKYFQQNHHFLKKTTDF